MQCISTTTVPVLGKPGEHYSVIVVNPMPEYGPAALLMELHSSAIGKSKALVHASVHGNTVRVVVVDFAIAKWGLEQNHELPAFAAILPAQGEIR